jgi:hypothetical protein
VTFSLRLTADLALALSARVVGDGRRGYPILHLSPDTDFQTVSQLSPGSSDQRGEVSSQSGALVRRVRSPIIWIGGTEPLDHPEVARFANALAALHPDTVPGKFVELHAEIQKLDVDGFLITTAALSPGLATRAAQLRRRLLNRRWALLSSLLDRSVAARLSRDSAEIARRLLPERDSDNFGEGAEAG